MGGGLGSIPGKVLMLSNAAAITATSHNEKESNEAEKSNGKGRGDYEGRLFRNGGRRFPNVACPKNYREGNTGGRRGHPEKNLKKNKGERFVWEGQKGRNSRSRYKLRLS